MQFLNRNWHYREQPNYLIESLNRRYGLNSTSSKILINRGVTDDDVDLFFNPKLKLCMPSPNSLQDMEKATDIICKHIVANNPICIMGDYDVDGMTSTSILRSYLKHYTDKIDCYIPDRFDQGYGGNESSVKDILTSNPKLVIMLDTGSTSYELIAQLNNLGIEVVVIDHHTIEVIMPNAQAIINPSRIDDKSGLEYLCTAGLVFLILVALHPKLAKVKQVSYNLLVLLDLVALATVCDMVPLVKLNRAYVKQGLKVLQKFGHVGLKALLEVMEFDGELNYETLGFTLGPAINAASRMGSQSLALKLLLVESKEEALKLALALRNANLKRQQDENHILKNAISEVEYRLDTNQELIFVGDKTWSKGLVGLVAGKIKDIYNKPACIYNINDEGIATASGRSIKNVHMGNIVLLAKKEGLLVKGGGHSQAVGFSFEVNKKEQIEEFFSKQIIYQKQRNILTEDFIDDKLSLSAVNKNLINSLNQLQPFGVSFAEPIFLFESIFFKNVKTIGKYNNHLSFYVTDGYKFVKGICFKVLPSKMGEAIVNSEHKAFNILATPKISYYKGNIQLNLQVIDLVQQDSY